MRDEGGYFTILVCACFICGWIGGCVGSKTMEQEAIKHNAAHYDSKTGEFKWNDEKGK